jgi:hypothetical protein
MTPVNELLSKLDEITDGIDKTETDHPDGWWETEEGLQFGISVLRELRLLVKEAHRAGQEDMRERAKIVAKAYGPKTLAIAAEIGALEIKGE